MANNQRIGPLFSFLSGRLVQNHLKDTVNPSAFYSYRTAYDNNPAATYQNSSPIFNSGRRPMVTTRSLTTPRSRPSCTRAIAIGWACGPTRSSCRPRPLITQPPRYLNPTSYQIISPGKDGIFGLGTPIASWSAAADCRRHAGDDVERQQPRRHGVPRPSGNYNYKDDQSNFAPGILDAGS